MIVESELPKIEVSDGAKDATGTNKRLIELQKVTTSFP
jgi:hypothetical protein